MGKAERERGKRGERMLSAELSRLFSVECHRRQQYNGTAGDDDVAGLPGVFVESKFVEKLNVRQAVERAVVDCPADLVPVVCHKTIKKPWLVTLRLDDLPRLVERLYLTLSTESESR